MVSKSQESWSKVSHAAREMVTVFSLNFRLSNSSWSNSQSALPPPMENVSAPLWLDVQNSCHHIIKFAISGCNCYYTFCSRKLGHPENSEAMGRKRNMRPSVSEVNRKLERTGTNPRKLLLFFLYQARRSCRPRAYEAWDRGEF